ncbi:hypothetical protein WCLP8_1140006 [uncultured Gammaproteobacteria bacterium]
MINSGSYETRDAGAAQRVATEQVKQVLLGDTTATRMREEQDWAELCQTVPWGQTGKGIAAAVPVADGAVLDSSSSALPQPKTPELVPMMAPVADVVLSEAASNEVVQKIGEAFDSWVQNEGGMSGFMVAPEKGVSGSMVEREPGVVSELLETTTADVTRKIADAFDTWVQNESGMAGFVGALELGVVEAVSEPVVEPEPALESATQVQVAQAIVSGASILSSRSLSVSLSIEALASADEVSAPGMDINRVSSLEAPPIVPAVPELTVFRERIEPEAPAPIRSAAFKLASGPAPVLAPVFDRTFENFAAPASAPAPVAQKAVLAAAPVSNGLAKKGPVRLEIPVSDLLSDVAGLATRVLSGLNFGGGSHAPAKQQAVPAKKMARKQATIKAPSSGPGPSATGKPPVATKQAVGARKSPGTVGQGVEKALRAVTGNGARLIDRARSVVRAVVSPQPGPVRATPRVDTGHR